MSALSVAGRGFIWSGIRDGLNRYAGSGIKVYKQDPQNPNSLSRNEVTVLAEDKEGMLRADVLAAIQVLG